VDNETESGILKEEGLDRRQRAFSYQLQVALKYEQNHIQMVLELL
jgi:hypothetical protein